jgi:hypothetical protein
MASIAIYFGPHSPNLHLFVARNLPAFPRFRRSTSQNRPSSFGFRHHPAILHPGFGARRPAERK